MTGRLEKEGVTVDDRAETSTLYNKGYFGTPQPGGTLRLTLMEALYLVETGRLVVRSDGREVIFKELLRRASTSEADFEVRYIVYRDLRQRGYVVKENHHPWNFRVYPRGGGPKKTPSKHWVLAVSERAAFDLDSLISLLRRANAVRRQMLLAVVDEESDLTYYSAKEVLPKGRITHLSASKLATAYLFEDRSMVPDEEEAKRLHDLGFFGKMVGHRLELSLIETAYLLKCGLIELRRARSGRKIGEAGLLREARKIQPDFDLRLSTFEDLKAKGVVVKTGFKYGSHFRAYEGDPEKYHAKYLVHALPVGFRGTWPEVSRAVRVAHGVRKQILFSRTGEEITYIKLERVRP